MDYIEIETNNQVLINKAKYYMAQITDHIHDINHINYVVYYTKLLLDKYNQMLIKKYALYQHTGIMLEE